MTATDLPEFNVTLKMARSTGSLADEVEHRTFTVRGPARNAKHAEAIAFGLGHGINEASGSAWKFCGGSDGVTVAPAAEGHTEVEQLRAELDRVRADLAAAHNHAHRQDTNLQQIARAKDEIAAERDALKAAAGPLLEHIDLIRAHWAVLLPRDVGETLLARGAALAALLPNTQEPCDICSGYGCPDCREDLSEVSR